MITHISTYTYEAATNLLDRLVLPTAGTVVDLGAGVRDNPISKQVAEITCDQLISVDAFDKYIPILRNIPVKAKLHVLICSDILNYSVPECDVVLLIDVIEHLDKASAIQYLTNLKHRAKQILVFTPEGDTIGYSNYHMANPKQLHISAWSAQDLEQLGFDVLVYDKFHAHVKARPIGAMWASWSRNEN